MIRGNEHALSEEIIEKKWRRGCLTVVGVMLMLVVTIVIAAVVSGFAGGLIGSNSNTKTPTLAMDVKIANSGNYGTTMFSATVTSISAPVSTSKLILTTSYSTTMKSQSWTTAGQYNGWPAVGKGFMSGGNSTLNGAPFGFGPGVSGTQNIAGTYTANQTFGNFTLTQGTGLVAEPSSTYAGYVGSGSSTSPMYTVLGSGWEQLSPGDVVTVRVIYTPTSKAIFQQDVVVTGA